MNSTKVLINHHRYRTPRLKQVILMTMLTSKHRSQESVDVKWTNSQEVRKKKSGYSAVMSLPSQSYLSIPGKRREKREERNKFTPNQLSYLGKCQQLPLTYSLSDTDGLLFGI